MNIKFKWVGAGCFILEINKTFKIACDPCMSPSGTLYDFGFFKSKRIFDPVFEKNDFNNVHLWLITHNHKDHLDTSGLEIINPESIIISHDNASNLLENRFKNLKILKWREEYGIHEEQIAVKVRAVPAIHGSNFISSYFAGGVNGYWLEARAGNESKVIYVTGDTIWNSQLSHSLGNRICDVLIPNMGAVKKDHFGGPLTLDNHMLVSMTKALEPLKVIPVHHGCFSHYSDDEKQLKEIHDARVNIPERGKTLEFNI